MMIGFQSRLFKYKKKLIQTEEYQMIKFKYPIKQLEK